MTPDTRVERTCDECGKLAWCLFYASQPAWICSDCRSPDINNINFGAGIHTNSQKLECLTIKAMVDDGNGGVVVKDVLVYGTFGDVVSDEVLTEVKQDEPNPHQECERNHVWLQDKVADLARKNAEQADRIKELETYVRDRDRRIDKLRLRITEYCAFVDCIESGQNKMITILDRIEARQ